MITIQNTDESYSISWVVDIFGIRSMVLLYCVIEMVLKIAVANGLPLGNLKIMKTMHLYGLTK